ncbi:DUF2255 family protein [Catenulispora subtropica]
MTPDTPGWNPDDLALLACRSSLVLTVGDEARNGVEIGMAVADGQLYVRAYRGPASRWYQAARTHPRGRIRLGDVTRDVVLHTGEPGPAERAERIDQAFIGKYGAVAAGLVAADAAREATIRITPAR